MPTFTTWTGDRAVFPKGAGPGDTLTFTDEGQERTGVIIDRAPQSVGKGFSAEANGYWFWVRPDEPHPDDPHFAVRVRYQASGRRAGEAYRDDGPYVMRSALGWPKVVKPGSTVEDVAS